MMADAGVAYGVARTASSEAMLTMSQRMRPMANARMPAWRRAARERPRPMSSRATVSRAGQMAKVRVVGVIRLATVVVIPRLIACEVLSECKRMVVKGGVCLEQTLGAIV